MATFEVSAHMTVRPGQLEGFRKQAARTKLFKDYADNHFMTVYGEPSQTLLDLLQAHAAGFKWFSFVQGLEP